MACIAKKVRWNVMESFNVTTLCEEQKANNFGLNSVF